MKSPFPGMDPYLERHWQDVHHRLCTYACDAIQVRLGRDLVARLGERLVVESPFGERRAIYPDVRVFRPAGGREFEEPAGEAAGGDAGGAATALATETAVEAVAEPLLVRLVGPEPETQAFIEISEPEGGRLVTVIEFLSPSNKVAGGGRELYSRKQQERLAARVNLVEIDLVRAGRRNLLLPDEMLPPPSAGTYVACVFRASTPHVREVYPFALDKPLPGIRVPLRPGEADVPLGLQKLVDQAYRNGRYERIDYGQPCVPPLEGDDAARAEALLKTAGRR